MYLRPETGQKNLYVLIAEEKPSSEVQSQRHIEIFHQPADISSFPLILARIFFSTPNSLWY